MLCSYRVLRVYIFVLSACISVIKMEGPPYVCKTDEVGEICVNSPATGSQYWGLTGVSNNTFRVSPIVTEGVLLSDAEYTRSGLLGFLGPVSCYICTKVIVSSPSNVTTGSYCSTSTPSSTYS